MSLCFYFMIGFQTINIYTRVDKKKIKSSRKEYVIGVCFKF